MMPYPGHRFGVLLLVAGLLTCILLFRPSHQCFTESDFRMEQQLTDAYSCGYSPGLTPEFPFHFIKKTCFNENQKRGEYRG